MPNMKKDRISVLIWLFFVSKVCVEHQYTTCLNLISDFFGVELFFAIGPKFRRVISKDQVVETLKFSAHISQVYMRHNIEMKTYFYCRPPGVVNKRAL